MATKLKVTQPASERLGTPTDREVTLEVELFEHIADHAEAIEKLVEKYGIDVVRTRAARQLRSEYGNAARGKLGEMETDEKGNKTSEYKFTEDEIVTYFEEDAGDGKPWAPAVHAGADPTKDLRKKFLKMSPEQRQAFLETLENDDEEVAA